MLVLLSSTCKKEGEDCHKVITIINNSSDTIIFATKSISKIFPYQGATVNCVNVSSLGLWLNGIPNLPLHSFLFHGSVAVYNTGIYNYSYLLTRP